MPKPVVESVVSEHADEASFLWLQRALATNAPNYDPDQFADLDERLAAQIDGLRVAGEDGWKFAERQMVSGEPEDLFPAAVLAIEIQDNRLDRAFDHLEAAPEAVPGMLSASGWVSAKFLTGVVKSLLSADAPHRRLAGIAACAFHRKDPGAVLARYLADPSPDVRARAVRAAGELGRLDLQTELSRAIRDRDATVAFWASWSAVLLGDREDALRRLNELALSSHPLRERALRLCLCAMDIPTSQRFLNQLAAQSPQHRALISGAGLSGDAKYLPWLIEQMSVPDRARIAGEAFSLITGLDIRRGDYEGLGPQSSEEPSPGISDDEDLEPESDVALPWPNVDKVKDWWKKNDRRFAQGQRYLTGELLAMESCQKVLRAGYQKQRVTAALHLAVMQPGSVLFPTSAPAWRQRRLLAAE